ncbi:MAG: hypothetical protein ACP5NO_08060 [Thermoplasmata archaeon]
MIDMSIALGTGKILTVLALNAHHHELSPSAPGLHDVHCMAVSVADSWTGESIAAFLDRLIASAGRPVAYLKDGGADLQKSIRLLDEQELGSPCIDDISHFTANLLKWWYEDQPIFETFLSSCGRVSGKLKQTLLACLAPPKVQTKSRFMNVHRLIRWADQLLGLSPAGGSRKGSILWKLRASMDQLPSCRTFIKRFRDDAAPLMECQRILKANGLSHSTIARCEPFIEAIGSSPVRKRFTHYLQTQIHTAERLGLDHIGLPVSSDQIESLFGLGKLHGTGEIKDANRIALRLPSLCGIPTREEAEQVVKITVAEERKITGAFTSLVKQRRQVLRHPDQLESLGPAQCRTQFDLITSTENREKNGEILNLSMHYGKTHDLGAQSQAGCG